MKTIVLDSQSSNLSVMQFLKGIGEDGARVLDSIGNTIAFVVSPADRDALAYAQAISDIEKNIDQVRRALSRQGGITTSELLARAEEAARRKSEP